jgi:hypothetical protein
MCRLSISATGRTVDICAATYTSMILHGVLEV